MSVFILIWLVCPLPVIGWPPYGELPLTEKPLVSEAIDQEGFTTTRLPALVRVASGRAASSTISSSESLAGRELALRAVGALGGQLPPSPVHEHPRHPEGLAISWSLARPRSSPRVSRTFSRRPRSDAARPPSGITHHSGITHYAPGD